MRRRDLFRALSAAPLAGWLSPWFAAAFGLAPGDARNAALIYRKASAWAEGLGPEDYERLRNAATVGLEDRQVTTLIHGARSALAALREAATIARCDWQNEVLTCDDLLKGQLASSNGYIIRVACLSARRHVALGRGPEALDDVFAGLTLAHRIGTGGVLIARLWEHAGENVAFQTLGHLLPSLDRATQEDLSRRLDVLPSPEPASAIVGSEARFIVGSVRAKLLKHGSRIAGDAWSDLGFDQDEAATLERLTGGDRTALVAHLEASGPAFSELARRLDLPRPEWRAAFDEFTATVRSTFPVVATLRKNGWMARHQLDRMLALRAMLRAGLALVRDGEPAFRTVSDPFGAGSFGLERRGNGYLIRSALNEDSRSEVILTVGDAA